MTVDKIRSPTINVTWGSAGLTLEVDSTKTLRGTLR